MNFFVFLLFYLICTAILFTILFIIFKKFYANKLIDLILKEAFEKNDINTNLENLNSLFKNFEDSPSNESKKEDNRLFF